MTSRTSPDLPVPPHPPASVRLAQQIEFILEADRLKCVLRRSPLLNADRKENDAEHSWHLALMAVVLAEYAAADVDISRVIRMVLIHDLVEIDAGDTFLYDSESQHDQAQREEAAADRLFGLLPEDQAAEWRVLWDEFEARDTPDARFAKAMDRFQPLLLNFHSGGGTWQTPGVSRTDVRQRKSLIGDGSAHLWEYAQELINEGVRRGYLEGA